MYPTNDAFGLASQRATKNKNNASLYALQGARSSSSKTIPLPYYYLPVGDPTTLNLCTRPCRSIQCSSSTQRKNGKSPKVSTEVEVSTEI